MTSKQTIQRLKEMRLSTMAKAYNAQLDEIERYKDLDFEERFAMLVDIEYSSRQSNKVIRLIKEAEFEQPQASITDINYESGRKLNKSLIKRLATCEYIEENHNIFITGATGSGKTYLANAFGIEACKRYYKTRFIRMNDFYIEADVARESHTYDKLLQKYAKPRLLIIDEWLLLKTSEEEARVIFDLLHKRRERSSTIFCSQYHQNEWYDQLGGEENPLSDAILDRIIHDSYEINITSVTPDKDISMREVYGLKNKEQEGKYGEAGE